MSNRKEEFEEIEKQLLLIFEMKNAAYGDDYFAGGYSDLERWMSIRRKIARLSTHYEKSEFKNLPDETLEDTWKDLAIYCIMELMTLKNSKEVKNGN